MKDLNAELEMLFDKWKLEHIFDEDYKENTPRFNGIFIPKENFLSDGFCISEPKEKTILYISKESHEYSTKNIHNNSLKAILNKNLYWLKQTLSDNKNPIFARRIKLMQEDALKEDLSNVTFMNINKRGGFEITNMEILRKYAIQYSKNIISEIEIINPKLIICCGSGLKDILHRLYDINNKIIPKHIIEIYHPSYHYISDCNYKKLFLNKLKKLEKQI